MHILIAGKTINKMHIKSRLFQEKYYIYLKHVIGFFGQRITVHANITYNALLHTF